MDLLNSHNFKVAITQLSNVQQTYNFTIGIKDIFECFMMVLNYRAAEY